MDNHAPKKTFHVAQRLTQPWINEEIAAAKKDRRECEKLWRNNKSTVRRSEYRESCERVKHLIRKAKEEYFIKKIDECQGDQKKLFQIVDKLLGRNKSTSLPHFTDSKIMARIFNEFFVTKISDIRCLLSTWESSATVMACPPLNSLLTASKSKLQIFKPTTVSEIITVIRKSSKASCALDPIPANLLCDLLPVLAPVITHLVNAALSSGIFPSQLKSAIVMPLLKKLGSDVEVLKNYRPVSNLSFISKVIERVVASRILDHMRENNLLDPMQSSYRSGHSTETALLRVHSDIVSAIDKGRGVFLILLDLSAALTQWTTRSFFHSLNIILVLMVQLSNSLKHTLQTELSACPSKVSCLNLVNWLTAYLRDSSLVQLLFASTPFHLVPFFDIIRFSIIYYAHDTQLYFSFDLDSHDEVLTFMFHLHFGHKNMDDSEQTQDQ